MVFNSFSDLCTTSNYLLLEKPTVIQLVKIWPAFYGPHHEPYESSLHPHTHFDKFKFYTVMLTNPATSNKHCKEIWLIIINSVENLLGWVMPDIQIQISRNTQQGCSVSSFSFILSGVQS
jgi:hypothetical protein